MPARRLEWAVAGGFAGWALARVAAADRLWPVDSQAVASLSFTPQVAAGAWLGALLLRDSRAAAVAAVAAGTMTAVVAPRGIARRQPEATGPVLRVLTVNLLVGRAAAAPLVGLVGITGADVLFVQELTADAAARLSAAGLNDLLPHAVDDLTAADSRGNAIYARYPLADCPTTVPTPCAQPVTTLSLPSGAARLACVHLHTPKPLWSRSGVSSWREELRGLSCALAPGDPPVIIAGDFNSTADHAEFRRLLNRGYADAASQSGMGLVPTWGSRPGRRALLTIDHVLVDRRCAVLGTSVHPLPGTDHRAVLAELRLPA